jgi:hypothetical protein
MRLFPTGAHGPAQPDDPTFDCDQCAEPEGAAKCDGERIGDRIPDRALGAVGEVRQRPRAQIKGGIRRDGRL